MKGEWHSCSGCVQGGTLVCQLLEKSMGGLYSLIAEDHINTNMFKWHLYFYILETFREKGETWVISGRNTFKTLLIPRFTTVLPHTDDIF